MRVRTRRGLFYWICSAAAALQAPLPSSAQCLVEELEAGDATPDAEYGRSVAIGDAYAVIGAPLDDQLGTNTGAVYVYRRQRFTWVLDAKLTANDSAPSDTFGTKVAVSGDRIAVGAPGDDDRGSNGGSVYVYRKSGSNWIREAKLIPLETVEDDEFGSAVAINGSYLVGASRRNDVGTSSGAVYVYQLGGFGWVAGPKITASDAAAGDEFGGTVDLSGSVLVVGARLKDGVGINSGAAYVFRRNGNAWPEEKKLTATDAVSGDEFGVSVATDGTRIAVGARLANVGAENNAGAAYIFRYTGSNWVQEAKLSAPDAMNGDQFGNSISLGNASVLIGAWHNTDAGIDTGSAYVFWQSNTTWSFLGKLTAGEPSARDEFGLSVAQFGNYGIVGIPKDDGIGLTSGSAAIFGVDGDCNANSRPDACDILEGVSNDFNSDTVPDDCRVVGDGDLDGDVDLVDILRFQSCFSGAGRPFTVGCGVFDANNDGDVDGSDYGQVRLSFNGP